MYAGKLPLSHRQLRPQLSPRRPSTSSDENSVSNAAKRKRKPAVKYSNIPVSKSAVDGGEEEIPDVCVYVCLYELPFKFLLYIIIVSQWDML